MLRPKQLNEFLEKQLKSFDIKNIFISNLEGQLVACAPLSDQQYFISCLSNLWMDFYFILGQLGQDSRMKKITLTHEKGFVYMTNLQNSLILGFETNKFENIGLFIKQCELINNFLQQEFKTICQ